MMDLQELKARRNVVDQIDWTMTPEKAIEMYLEWGTGWCRGNDFVRSRDQESIYFVLYDWEMPRQATLIKRSMRNAEEIAKIQVPPDLFDKACEEDGYQAGVGVHALNRDLKEWVCQLVDGPSLEYQ